VGVFAPIRDYVETLVHPSALANTLTAARHRAFIAPRLLGGIAALAAFPFYLIACGTPSAVEIVAFAWLVAPILTAYFLSRTGRYESAHAFSSLAIAGLATVLAASTGGVGSSALVWLVIVPLDASLSASRRVVATASIFALGAVGLLWLLGVAHLLPPDSGVEAPLAALGVVSALLYAAGLALGAAVLTRTGAWLLDAEEERYRLLARNMGDVITRHGRDGAVMFASPAAEMMFGVPVGALHGHGLFERVLVADRPAYLMALGDAAALPENRSVEFRVRRDCADGEQGHAGEFIWIEMHCRPLERKTAESGRDTGREVVAVLRDVSRRKAREQAFEQVHADTERAVARNARFLATMSHELRTPLNAIIGFSEMLTKEQSSTLTTERRHEYAALINESGHHLLSVVNGILDMSKLETDNFEIIGEPFAPASVIARCYELVALRARAAGIRLERTVGDDLPDMIADKRALTQILLNLLSNAIRFSDSGGRVVIGARAEAASILFTVEDDGVGIGEQDLARLGEPYFQAQSARERRHGGSGLGLSIVKGLVRLHGGELSIDSRIGRGTRVTVRLPLDCEQSRPAMRSAAPDSAAGPMHGLMKVPAAGGASRRLNSSAPRDPAVRTSSILVKKSA
jgi:cell cycle sensor histidine kinase DivJ